MQKRHVFLLLCSVFLCQLIQAQSQPPNIPTRLPAGTGIYDPRLETRVETLLRQMTLEEKVGQLVQYSAGQPTGPGTGRTDYDDMIAKGQIGALFNISTAKETNKYQKLAVEKSRLHIPILFGLDVIHGFRTEFPIPLALASTWDPQLVEQASRVAAQEATATGIRLTFSPMVDIARDARWGRMTEGAGEDPYLGSAMAAAYVRGYQGQRLDAPDSMAACAKHYVGYGAAEGGRDYNSTEISEHTLRQYYLPPFRAAVNAGAASIMSAFNSLNGVPASANPFTLRQVLKKEWGFKGLVDSDWTSVGELIPHGIAIDGATAARKALLAGVDMDMVSSLYHDHLANEVHAGRVPMADIDDAVRRILRVKVALGLFEHPYADESREASAMLKPESLTLARRAAERSFVLLRNEPVNGHPLLPLSSDVHNIALIGPLADDSSNMLGAWAGLGDGADVISFHKALAEHVGESHLFLVRGVDITASTNDSIPAALEAAQKADIVIAALGENSGEMTGEAASRAHLELPGRQQELLEKLVATGKPVVLILFSGRPLTLPWTFDHVPAVLAAWFPGIQAGPALVRTLYGEANPSGKLVVSWPRAVGQEPLYYNALSTGRPAGNYDLTKPPSNGDAKFVSRYIDEQNSPQFPFGFGLSYSTFQFGPTQISQKRLKVASLNGSLGKSDSVLTASAEIKNTGDRPGEAVVQLYVRLEGISVAQPVRALKSFQRVALQPGESKRVSFDLPADSFALWNDRNQFTVEAAKVTLWIAPDSASGAGEFIDLVP
jgi:beta-glucosidase